MSGLKATFNSSGVLRGEKTMHGLIYHLARASYLTRPPSCLTVIWATAWLYLGDTMEIGWCLDHPSPLLAGGQISFLRSAAAGPQRSR